MPTTKDIIVEELMRQSDDFERVDFRGSRVGIEGVINIDALAAAIDAVPVRTFRSDTTFPLLAVARWFGVDYREVLLFADICDVTPVIVDPLEPWQIATKRAVYNEACRRIVF